MPLRDRQCSTCHHKATDLIEHGEYSRIIDCPNCGKKTFIAKITAPALLDFGSVKGASIIDTERANCSSDTNKELGGFNISYNSIDELYADTNFTPEDKD